MAKSWYQTIRAPYLVQGRWVWVECVDRTGNKHLAMISKAKELGATKWYYDQASVTDTGFSVAVQS